MFLAARGTILLIRCLVVSGSTFVQFRNAEVSITHIDWIAFVDFRNEIIQATATYDVRRNPDIWIVYLDITADLTVSAVSSPSVHGNFGFQMTTTTDHNSYAILVELPDGIPEEFQLVIVYETSPVADGLIWASKEMTLAEKTPLLYTQTPPNNARSIIPCQDIPEAKFTFSAHVEVPTGMNAVMGATVRQVTRNSIARTQVYHFEQDVPISGFMIALAVGYFYSCQLAPNKYVYEETTPKNSAFEKISEIRRILATTDQIVGPSQFRIFNMVVLPLHYPYIREEATSNLILLPWYTLDGENSLTDFLVFQVVHSWLSNLLTPRSWRHIWITKAFALFYSMKIFETLNGTDYANMKARMIVDHLSVTLNAKAPAETKLVGVADDPHPKDVDIATGKGFVLLRYIEKVIDTAEMNRFASGFIAHFQDKSVDTADFLNYLNKSVKHHTVISEIDFDKWLYGEGRPPVMPKFITTWDDAVDLLKERWDEENNDFSNFNKTDIVDWPPIQISYFLQKLGLKEARLSKKKLAKLAEIYKLSDSSNVQVLYDWFKLCLNGRYEPAVEDVENFIRNSGQTMYSMALVNEMSKWYEYSGKSDLLFLEIKRKLPRQSRS